MAAKKINIFQTTIDEIVLGKVENPDDAVYIAPPKLDYMTGQLDEAPKRCTLNHKTAEIAFPAFSI